MHTSLTRIEQLVADNAILRDAVMDIQLDDDTLVVLTDASVPRSFVRNFLGRHWQGSLDVFCATGLMIGACEIID